MAGGESDKNKVIQGVTRDMQNTWYAEATKTNNRVTVLKRGGRFNCYINEGQAAISMLVVGVRWYGFCF